MCIRDRAISELHELEKNNENNEKKIKLFLLPKDEADTKNAIIEIRAGTGGLEASLFASDLFKMYEKVSHKKKWLLEVISISKSDAGGLKEVIASIKGIPFIDAITSFNPPASLLEIDITSSNHFFL